jgi:predicted NUDIX family phosphoesterase
MSLVQTEQVLVIPTERFRQVGYFQGFSAANEQYLDQLLQPRYMSFQPRDQMEHDPGFKQLIPYVIIRHADGDASSVFAYRRGSGQGEKRLHALLSVGVGGHICSQDAGGDFRGDPYQEGLQRELDEEVVIDTTYRQRVVGLINDDLTEVGQVHLGIVHLLDVDRPAVRPREDDLLEAGFRRLDDLRSRAGEMESWSRLCFEALCS